MRSASSFCTCERRDPAPRYPRKLRLDSLRPVRTRTRNTRVSGPSRVGRVRTTPTHHALYATRSVARRFVPSESAQAAMPIGRPSKLVPSGTKE